MTPSPDDALGELEDAISDLHEPYQIGDDYEFRTVQDAYDDAMTEGVPPLLDLTASYHPQRDQYPLTFHGTPDSREWIRFAIDGHGVAQLGHAGVTGDVIQIHGPPGGGQYAYKKPATLQGFTIRGGSGGSQIHIAGVPNGRIATLICAGPGDGIKWSGPWLDMDVDMSHSFGWNLHGVTAWGTQTGFGAGPRAGAHSTTFTDCRANACTGTGLAFKGAANVVWRGGDIQLCKRFGAALRECLSPTIRDAYIEGNGRAVDYPLEIYARTTTGLTVDANYFHGTNPRPVTHEYNWVQRGVNLQDSRGASITNNTALRYGEGLVAAHTNSSAEVHNNTQHQDDAPILGRITSDSTVTEYGQPINGTEA